MGFKKYEGQGWSGGRIQGEGRKKGKAMRESWSDIKI